MGQEAEVIPTETVAMMDREAEAVVPTTMCEAFQAIAAARRDQVALRTHRDGVQITWGEYAERVRKIAAGLHALGLGHGDRLALMLVNRPEFHLLDAAAMHLGAIPFSLYNTLAPGGRVPDRRPGPKFTIVEDDSSTGPRRHVLTVTEIREISCMGATVTIAPQAGAPVPVLTLLGARGRCGHEVEGR